MRNKVCLVNTCDYLLDDFCGENFEGSTVIDGYILKFNNKYYEMIRCEEVGAYIKDVAIYRLEEFKDYEELKKAENK